MPYLSDFFEDDPEAFRKRQEMYPNEGLVSILPEIADFVKTAKYYPNEPHPSNEPTAEEMAVNLGFAPQEATMAPPARDLSGANISNMAEKQKLDYNASRGGAVAPTETPTLASLFDAQRQKEGWTSVPGTSSFMHPGGTGAYRVESGTTPEGQRATAAADSLRAFNKAKYGGFGRYGGAGAEVLNPAESIAALGRQAYAAGSEKRMQDQSMLTSLEEKLKKAILMGDAANPSVVADLERQLKELGPMVAGKQKAADAALAGSTGTADLLKPMQEMMDKEQQRQEYGQLAALLNGGKNPGPMNKATYDAYGNAIKSQREERRLDNADRSFNRLMGNDQYNRENPKMTQPSAARVKQSVEAILGAQGYRLGRVGGSDYVFKGTSSTPEKNSPQIIAAAMQQAQSQMMPQRPAANPNVVNNPGVKAVAEMMKAEKAGALPPHQAPLLQRYKQNVITIQKELMSKGMDQQTAAEQATIIAAGSITGMR